MLTVFSTMKRKCDQDGQDCPVCCSKLTDYKRKPIECPGCDYKACLSCVKWYLLTSADAHCMNCRTPWTNQFLLKNFTKHFIFQELARHHDKIFLLLERSLMQSTMNQMQPKTNNSASAESFRCRHDTCPGFVFKSQPRCKVCNRTTCLSCMKISSDDIAKHTCDPNDVAAVKLIRADSKPCPNCKEFIEKIHGCDQMFCTQCHTAFDWKTNQVIHGRRVHNPHYFEWLQNNPQQQDQVPQQGRCNVDISGRNNSINTFRRLHWEFERNYSDDVSSSDKVYIRNLTFAQWVRAKNLKLALQNLWRVSEEMYDHAVLQSRRDEPVTERNRDLRISLLSGEISESTWQTRVISRRRSDLGFRDHLQVVEAFNLLVINVFESINTQAQDVLQELEASYERAINVCTYFNSCLRDTSREHNSNLCFKIIVPSPLQLSMDVHIMNKLMSPSEILRTPDQRTFLHYGDIDYFRSVLRETDAEDDSHYDFIVHKMFLNQLPGYRRQLQLLNLEFDDSSLPVITYTDDQQQYASIMNTLEEYKQLIGEPVNGLVQTSFKDALDSAASLKHLFTKLMNEQFMTDLPSMIQRDLQRMRHKKPNSSKLFMLLSEVHRIVALCCLEFGRYMFALERHHMWHEGRIAPFKPNTYYNHLVVPFALHMCEEMLQSKDKTVSKTYPRNPISQAQIDRNGKLVVSVDKYRPVAQEAYNKAKFYLATNFTTDGVLLTDDLQEFKYAKGSLRVPAWLSCIASTTRSFVLDNPLYNTQLKPEQTLMAPLIQRQVFYATLERERTTRCSLEEAILAPFVFGAEAWTTDLVEILVNRLKLARFAQSHYLYDYDCSLHKPINAIANVTLLNSILMEKSELCHELKKRLEAYVCDHGNSKAVTAHTTYLMTNYF